MCDRIKKIHRGGVIRLYKKLLGDNFSEVMWSSLRMYGYCLLYNMKSIRYRERRYPVQVSVSAGILNGRCGVLW